MQQEQADTIVDTIARVCHEANRAWCSANGDQSQLEWEQAPEWQRETCVLGVMFMLANPDAPASATHDSWMAQKVKEGWVYGEVKDPVAKTHPCMRPFEQLPPAQQAKDRLFQSIVRTLGEGAAYQVIARPGGKPNDQLCAVRLK